VAPELIATSSSILRLDQTWMESSMMYAQYLLQYLTVRAVDKLINNDLNNRRNQ